MVDSTRREIFKDDLTKLRGWASQTGAFSGESMRDASVVLCRWLWDEHPLLLGLCDETGVQLLLPGHPASLKASQQVHLRTKSEFSSFSVGESKHGMVWIAPSDFGDEISFTVQGYPVSHHQFVKLVRNKLGGAHYDDVKRQRWQRELVASVQGFLLGKDEVMNLQMRRLVGAVLKAVEKCGIEKKL